MKRTILIIAPGFYPAKNYGGPVVSIQNLVELIGDSFNIYIVTRDHELGENNRLDNITNGWNKYRNAKIKYLKDSQFKTAKIEEISKKIGANVIYVNSIFDYKLLLPSLKASKKLNTKLLIAPRGELCENAFNIKRKKKSLFVVALRQLIKNNDIYFQSTSKEETQSILEKLKTNRKNIIELTNIPTIIKPSNNRLKKNKGELKAVYVGRIHPKKNLLYTIDCLKRVNGKVEFDIYGPLEDKTYWSKIEKEMSRMPKNISIRYIKNLNHDEVINTMSNYHCFLFNTLSENYGHTIAESINSNCIPIISDTTPWNDLSDYDAGFISSLNDKKKSVANIQSVINMNQADYIKILNNLSLYRKKKMDIGAIKEMYTHTFLGLIK